MIFTYVLFPKDMENNYRESTDIERERQRKRERERERESVREGEHYILS